MFCGTTFGYITRKCNEHKKLSSKKFVKFFVTHTYATTSKTELNFLAGKRRRVAPRKQGATPFQPENEKSSNFDRPKAQGSSERTSGQAESELWKLFCLFVGRTLPVHQFGTISQNWVSRLIFVVLVSVSDQILKKFNFLRFALRTVSKKIQCKQTKNHENLLRSNLVSLYLSYIYVLNLLYSAELNV